jgi:hypothetical protein
MFRIVVIYSALWNRNKDNDNMSKTTSGGLL